LRSPFTIPRFQRQMTVQTGHFCWHWWQSTCSFGYWVFVVASSSWKELIQMMVIGQMTLTNVSSTAKTFVKTSSKKFCIIDRQFLKYGKGVGHNVSRAVRYYRLSADFTSASAFNSFGVSLEWGIGIQPNLSLALRRSKTTLKEPILSFPSRKRPRRSANHQSLGQRWLICSKSRPLWKWMNRSSLSSPSWQMESLRWIFWYFRSFAITRQSGMPVHWPFRSARCTPWR
jgi:hypothetical protein